MVGLGAVEEMHVTEQLYYYEIRPGDKDHLPTYYFDSGVVEVDDEPLRRVDNTAVRSVSASGGAGRQSACASNSPGTGAMIGRPIGSMSSTDPLPCWMSAVSA